MTTEKAIKKLDKLVSEQKAGVKRYRELNKSRFNKDWGFVKEKEFYRVIKTLNRKEKMIHNLEASLDIQPSESWR